MTAKGTPCGRTRREFLWEAGGGFVGAALTYLLFQDGFFPNLARAGEAANACTDVNGESPNVVIGEQRVDEFGTALGDEVWAAFLLQTLHVGDVAQEH